MLDVFAAPKEANIFHWDSGAMCEAKEGNICMGLVLPLEPGAVDFEDCMVSLRRLEGNCCVTD